MRKKLTVASGDVQEYACAAEARGRGGRSRVGRVGRAGVAPTSAAAAPGSGAEARQTCGAVTETSCVTFYFNNSLVSDLCYTVLWIGLPILIKERFNTPKGCNTFLTHDAT